MAQLKTPDDLGRFIRQRRKALAWDQAKLAHEVGVSRRWVIEIEKGKPGAELSLILRTLNVLGIRLEAMSPDSSAVLAGGGASRGIQLPDINRVIDRNRLDFRLQSYPAAHLAGETAGTPVATRPSAVGEPSPAFPTAAETGTSADESTAALVGGWLARTQPPKAPRKPR